MAAQPPTSWFRVNYDSLARGEGVEEFIVWQTKILSRDVVNKLQDLVTQKMGEHGKSKGRALFAGVDDGLFNMIFKFKFSAKGPPEVVLRLPEPGFTAPALAAEKLENEAHWMQYMEETGVLKVPHLYCWDSSEGGGPDSIGPYLLMDFVEGESLLKWLPKWGADEKKRDFVYEQLAEMYLRLHRARFDRIGSITKTPEKTWAVTRRPLTQDMHQQAIGIPGFPIDWWPSGPLDHAEEYKALLVGLHAHQLRCLRNLNIPVKKVKWDFTEQEGDQIDMDRALEIAGLRWTARRAFAEGAAPSFEDDNDNNDNNDNNDADGFIVFNMHLHSRNILVDPDTAVITAVLDLEGTNAMPAAFARDPPLWLDDWALDMSLEYDVFPQWLERYEATLGHFLSIMERVEARNQQKEEQEQEDQPHKPHKPHEPPLSAPMRASWESKQCLVNFATQNSDYFDALYWALPGVFPALDGSSGSAASEELQKYQAWTRRQIAAYEKERLEKAVKVVE